VITTKLRVVSLWIFGAIAVCGAAAHAGQFGHGGHRCQCPEAHAPTHNPWQRAGNPQHVARWATPTNTLAYSGGWVGGGAARDGDAPALDEGTWGWDYHGRIVPQRVWLRWWHGRRHQGGAGRYKTDGPKPVQRILESAGSVKLRSEPASDAPH